MLNESMLRGKHHTWLVNFGLILSSSIRNVSADGRPVVEFGKPKVLLTIKWHEYTLLVYQMLTAFYLGYG